MSLGEAAPVLGVLLTMVQRDDEQTRAIMNEVRSRYGGKVFDLEIQHDSAIEEAPTHGQSIFDNAPHSQGADQYQAFVVEEVIDWLESLRIGLRHRSGKAARSDATGREAIGHACPISPLFRSRFSTSYAIMEGHSDLGRVFDDPEDDSLLEGSPPSLESRPRTKNQDRIRMRMASRRGSRTTNQTLKGRTLWTRGRSEKRSSWCSGAIRSRGSMNSGQGGVQLSLAQLDGGQAGSREDAQRFIAVLKQESPQFLSDVTGP